MENCRYPEYAAHRVNQMIDLQQQQSFGAQVYAANCAACHGAERQGDPQLVYPSLINIRDRMNNAEINRIIENGKGIMPAFALLSTEDRRALIAFLKEEPEDKLVSAAEKPLTSPYGYTGFNRFFDHEGYPAVKPPWGTLNAIDLNTGEYL